MLILCKIYKKLIILYINNYGCPVGAIGSALRYERKGWEFESLTGYKLVL